MGDKTLDTNVSHDEEVQSAAALEEALVAGFTDDNDYNVPNEKEAGPEAPSATDVKDTLPKAEDADAPIINEAADAQTELPAKDEWEGVSDVIRDKFKTMGTELERVTNIANSASGRANKLQSQIQREAAKPEDAPQKLTSQQIHEAIVDKEKRDVLREEWPDFAAAFDEMDATISNAVGSQIDVLKNDILKGQHEATVVHQQYVADQIKYTLDTRHPGWENTVVDKSFKDWVYKDGPAVVERDEYENALRYAQSLKNNSPAESEALFTQANQMYGAMLTKYPAWASDRGTLYGDPSGSAAVKLLDMHKSSNKPEIEEITGLKDEYAAQQERNRERLVRNIAPTSGDGRQVSVDDKADVQEAFESGFNS